MKANTCLRISNGNSLITLWSTIKLCSSKLLTRITNIRLSQKIKLPNYSAKLKEWKQSKPEKSRTFSQKALSWLFGSLLTRLRIAQIKRFLSCVNKFSKLTLKSILKLRTKSPKLLPSKNKFWYTSTLLNMPKEKNLSHFWLKPFLPGRLSVSRKTSQQWCSSKIFTTRPTSITAISSTKYMLKFLHCWSNSTKISFTFRR